jgi:hypothetical protein
MDPAQRSSHASSVPVDAMPHFRFCSIAFHDLPCASLQLGEGSFHRRRAGRCRGPGGAHRGDVDATVTWMQHLPRQRCCVDATALPWAVLAPRALTQSPGRHLQTHILRSLPAGTCKHTHPDAVSRQAPGPALTEAASASALPDSPPTFRQRACASRRQTRHALLDTGRWPWSTPARAGARVLRERLLGQTGCAGLDRTRPAGRRWATTACGTWRAASVPAPLVSSWAGWADVWPAAPLFAAH